MKILVNQVAKGHPNGMMPVPLSWVPLPF